MSVRVIVTYTLTDRDAAKLSPTGDPEDFEIGEDSYGMLDEVAQNLGVPMDLDVRFD